MTNARAISSLRQMRDQLARMPEAIPVVATRSAEAIQRAIAENIAAGRAPDGTPWLPRADGGKALAGAARAVDVVAVGATVIATVSGVEARHSRGKVKGGVARPIIPRKLPASLRDEIGGIAVEELSRKRGTP